MTRERVPVLANHTRDKGPGTVAWDEHARAWTAYARRTDWSAEQIADRGGFCYGELCDLLGREPKTWRPRLEVA